MIIHSGRYGSNLIERQLKVSILNTIVNLKLSKKATININSVRDDCQFIGEAYKFVDVSGY